MSLVSFGFEKVAISTFAKANFLIDKKSGLAVRGESAAQRVNDFYHGLSGSAL